MTNPHVVLAEPSGFCAGVESAVKSLAWMVVLHRPPVFCVHDVVHNEDVVRRFERLGVRFVDDPDDAPPGVPVVLSAHGSAPDTVQRAARRASVMVDAVCPLVTKVHHEIRSRSRARSSVVLYVGHPGHDEAVGAMAQAPDSVVAVAMPEDVRAAAVPDGATVAVLAQTTLAHDDWHDVVAAARRRFGEVWLPPRDDLCFATTNRQAAARALAERCHAVVVVGSATSSNTRALADTARRAGCPTVVRVAGPDGLPADLLVGLPPSRAVVGVTAGASTPADAVDGVVHALRPWRVDRLKLTEEDEYFPLARPVRQVLRELARQGRLSPALHDAFVNDRATRAADLLARIDDGGLVGALQAAAPAVLSRPTATRYSVRWAS
jgi:4-hydroxy-3-methylbut-2-en-1-yl diphosphate reductase